MSNDGIASIREQGNSEGFTKANNTYNDDHNLTNKVKVFLAQV